MKVTDILKALSIRNKLLLIFITAFVPLATLGSLIVYSQVKQTIAANIESELNNSTAAIVNTVRTAAAVSIKNRLRAVAEKNREIAAHIYNRYQSENRDESKAIQRIRDVFLGQTIGKTGYIYCIDSNGTAVLHPHSGVEGKNFDHFGFIQEQIQKKEGYIEYDWKNPGEPEFRPKALYMTYFKPLDWIISVSTYREEFKELIDVADFKSGIANLRFGQTGYPYVTDIEGNVLIHPKLAGINIFTQQKMPVDFLRDMIVRKSGKIVYDWKNPGEKEIREKLVMFNYLPEYEWIVASSSYTDEIFAPLKRIRNIIMLALIAALVVASLLTFLISGSITKPLHSMMQKFATGAEGDFSVRMHHRHDDELGRLAQYFNTFMDRLTESSLRLREEIADRRQAVEALRQSENQYRQLYEDSQRSEELYRSMLNTSPDAIVYYDLDGRVRFMSPSFTRIFGWTFEELEGQRIPFVPESERGASMRIIRDLLENGTPCSGFETRRYTKDGRLIDVNASAARYHDHEGNPAGMLSILRDISETKQLQAQIQQSQRMESVGTLAGGIAHDFNNLLMGIQGRASLALSDMDAAHPATPHLRGIEEYVKSATGLTQQLLGFARGGKYELLPTNVNDIIRHSTELFGRTHKELIISLDLTEHIRTVEVDRSQLEQVLINLYVNAWQAMPRGGELKLKTNNVTLPADQTDARDLREGPYVEISVSDNGIGMDETLQRKIFDPFFTTKARGRGTGLGLSSAYGIISNHGGAITVQSLPGQGTTFHIYLPGSDKVARNSVKKTDLMVRGTGTVLLVDDESFILDVGQKLLQKIGYRVMPAEGGKAAVELYRHHAHEIDIVILDMIMPDMPGEQVFDALKHLNPEVAVLLSSGYSIDGQAAAILERGCAGFIQKPFSMQQLSQKLNEVLDAEIR